MTSQTKTNFLFDLKKYKAGLINGAKLSKLYSDAPTPYLNSRFIEKLYIQSSDAEDITRKDNSFDAISRNRAGIGIKTFGIQKIESKFKTEKIAQFKGHSNRGAFDNLIGEKLIKTVIELRNQRVKSDCIEESIDIEKSLYHCLVRAPGIAFVHEEPYELIDNDKIFPVTSSGIKASKFSKTDIVWFSDSNSIYKFTRADSQLYKTFSFSKGKQSKNFRLAIDKDIWKKILNNDFRLDYLDEVSNLRSKVMEQSIVLPLYSISHGSKKIFTKSGINHWNANDGKRKRKFNETYIPIPVKVRQKFPNFLPPKDVSFSLLLPNKNIISAKVCQQDGKALMSNPNTALLDWFQKLIDVDDEKMILRQVNRIPYKYSDLLRVGKDSLRITLLDKKKLLYKLEMCSIDSYEEFIEE